MPNMIASVAMTLTLTFMFLLGYARVADPTKVHFAVANRIASTGDVLFYAFIALVAILVLLALTTGIQLLFT